MIWYKNIPLLIGVADEWRRIREEFGFGLLTPISEIEQKWEELVRSIDTSAKQIGQNLSSIIQLHNEMHGDQDLLADLKRVWDQKVPKFKKREYPLDDVQSLVLAVFFWRAVRCADRYRKLSTAPLRGWASVFWYDFSLAKELIEAAKILSKGDRGPRGTIGLPALPQEGQDLQAAADREADADFEPQLARIRAMLSSADFAMFLDFWQNGQVQNLASIAARHGRTTKELKLVLSLAGMALGKDLLLLPLVADRSGIPTAGKNLIVVSQVAGELHFRIFNFDGYLITDVDERQLTGQAQRIETLRNRLRRLWPPYQLTAIEKGRLITLVWEVVRDGTINGGEK